MEKEKYSLIQLYVPEKKNYILILCKYDEKKFEARLYNSSKGLRVPTKIISEQEKGRDFFKKSEEIENIEQNIGKKKKELSDLTIVRGEDPSHP